MKKIAGSFQDIYKSEYFYIHLNSLELLCSPCSPATRARWKTNCHSCLSWLTPKMQCCVEQKPPPLFTQCHPKHSAGTNKKNSKSSSISSLLPMVKKVLTQNIEWQSISIISRLLCKTMRCCVSTWLGTWVATKPTRTAQRFFKDTSMS